MLNFLVLTVLAGQPASSPRLSLPFNDSWQFYRGDILPGAKVAWRTVDLPHDYQIEDRPPLPGQAATPISVVSGEWRFKLGDNPAWKNPAFDDGGWQKAQLPATWAKTLGRTPSNSFGWYRRRVKLPVKPGQKEVTISVGKIDDSDETFVNGVKVGATGAMPPHYSGAWTITRRYPVPVKLLKGDGSDTIAVRVYNGDGEAGIYAEAGKSVRSGPFDSEAADGYAEGFTVGGVAWYQKSLDVPASWRGKRVELYFDGVYMRSQFYCNGKKVDEHPYGYTGYRIDLTDSVRFGAKNLVAVRTDTTPPNSRWYTGSGIYRQVTLNVYEPTHVDPWDVQITTEEIAPGAATVLVNLPVHVQGRGGLQIDYRVKSPKGEEVAHMASGAADIGTGTTPASVKLAIPNPQLWSPDSPSLYTLNTEVRQNGKLVDTYKTSFGVRTFQAVPGKGLFLNGKEVKLFGGCMHHDNGPLGSCAFPRAEERRVQIMKSAGYNAIRTAHNPPSQAFLDACDREGMLVLDEAIDAWKINKGTNYGDYFDKWYAYDLGAMVQRDRNHPSVVMWSIGNEIPEQQRPEGPEIGQKLIDAIRKYDTTRPIAQAAYGMGRDWAKIDPLFDKLDVCGYNYSYDTFPSVHEAHPERLMMQTESQSERSFASTMMLKDHSYVVGDFIWTGWDYLGEVGVGRIIYPGDSGGFFGEFPWVTTGSGEIDMDGVLKPQAQYRRMLFSTGPVVCAFAEPTGEGVPKYRISGWGWRNDVESWTWPGREGKPMLVRVYGNVASVSLSLNGRDLGRKDTNRENKFTATFEVPYEPGTLVATGYGPMGKPMATWKLVTAGPPAAIKLTADRPSFSPGGQDLLYVSAEVVDKNGVRCPNSAELIHFEVTGAAKLAGVGNGDSQSIESFQQTQRHAYLGRCLAILRSDRSPGKVTLRATAKGLPEAKLQTSTR